jgi:DNA helicase-2/ATP-dependent DNA helicase PcrA
MNNYDLTGMHGVVTGGAQGIGEAITRRLVASGARVTIWDQDQVRAQQLVMEGGGQVDARAVDVTNFEEVAHAAGRLGDVDILICNAGISGPNMALEDYSLEDWRTIDLTLFSFDQVKEINLKREYSFTSHITLFESCAEQYRFFKELEFAAIRTSPMLFGTLVHHTIEDIHKAVLRGEEHKVTPDVIEGWFSTNYAMLSKKERVYLAPITLEAARKHVMRYYEREKCNFDRVKETEVEIALVKNNYILKGNADLIRGEGGTVEVVDFKSEKKPDLQRDCERLRQYQRQLEVYAHLIEERTGQKVSRMHLYFTGEQDGNPFVSFAKDDRAIGNTVARFDEIVHRIENADYRIAARPYRLCENCDMRAYCDAKNWNFREDE